MGKAWARPQRAAQPILGGHNGLKAGEGQIFVWTGVA